MRKADDQDVLDQLSVHGFFLQSKDTVLKQKNKNTPSSKVFWPFLIPGTLIKRYKRFLADVELENGQVITAHCPNSGSMATCSEPGRTVYLSLHDNPKRKLKYTWELIKMPTSLVGTNTLMPNRLVYNAIISNKINELTGYDTVLREVGVGNHTRLDLKLENPKQTCFVEVKNCTLIEDRIAMFPDAVTQRGLKHLREMQRLLKTNVRCVMFYLVQRMDAAVFKPAAHIDPAYAEGLTKACDNGLEILVYDVTINLSYIEVNRKLPFELTP